MFVITIATGIYAIISSFGSVSKRLAPLNNLIGTATCLLLPLVIPLAVKIRDALTGDWWLNRETRVHSSVVEENIIGVEGLENEVKEDEHLSHDQNSEEAMKAEIGVKLMLQRIEFWLYYFVYFFGATLGLVFLNNLGQIAESRGYSATSSLVSLSSSFGFFGRLIPSLLGYFFSRSKYMISSPASIAAVMAPMAAAFILLLNKSNIALYTSTAIIGVCTGAITSISVSTTTELFGTKNFSVNHNVVVTNIPVGSFLFGYLAALVYRKQGHNEDGKCMGMECYRNTFILWGCFCFLGTFLALILYARTRKFYSQRYFTR
ncbi:Protein NUCLEAR FUSION DEFECTIVE 4 [Melia azedarach]|nr:Protein NUCLEAR FUSION DEFECTIVE 4 [Melia azedarach]